MDFAILPLIISFVKTSVVFGMELGYRPLLKFGVALVDFGDGSCDAMEVVEEGTVEVEEDGGGFRWWSYVDHVDDLGRLLMVRLFFSNVLFNVVQVRSGFVFFCMVYKATR